MTTPLRTRLAPTPSGFLHLGNAFNFLLTYVWARQAGAEVFLRIDDGDADRTRPEFVEDVFRSLEWLGLTPDGGPSSVAEQESHYSQQLRQARYREAVDRLLEAGQAYACQCSRKDIQAVSANGRYPGTCRELGQKMFEEPHALRAALPQADTWITVTDFAGQQRQVNLFEEESDFVLWRKDGLAAYHLVSVMEDEAMEITHLVRGQDLWDSTVAQLWLAQTLDLQMLPKARFLHHPLMMGEGGLKLSKSAGSTSLKHRREAGQSVSAVYQAFLEWLGQPKAEVMTLEELQSQLEALDFDALFAAEGTD